MPELAPAHRSCSSIRWRARRVTGIGGAARGRSCGACSSTITGADSSKYTIVLIFMIVAVSSTVLTGWAGQLSLGQFAFVGVGVYLTGYYGATSKLSDLPVGRSALVVVAWGVGVAIVIGLPALRVQGLNLAIITLGFQLAGQHLGAVQRRACSNNVVQRLR